MKYNPEINHNVMINPSTVNEIANCGSPERILIDNKCKFSEKEMRAYINLPHKDTLWFSTFVTGEDLPKNRNWWKGVEKSFYEKVESCKSFFDLWRIIRNTNTSSKDKKKLHLMKNISYNKVASFLVYKHLGSDIRKCEELLINNFDMVVPIFKADNIGDLKEYDNKNLLILFNTKGKGYDWNNSDFLRRASYTNEDLLNELVELYNPKMNLHDFLNGYKAKCQNFLLTMTKSEIVGHYPQRYIQALFEEGVIRNGKDKVTIDTFKLFIHRFLEELKSKGKISDVNITREKDGSCDALRTVMNIEYLSGKEEKILITFKSTQEIKNYCNKKGIRILNLFVRKNKIKKFAS